MGKNNQQKNMVPERRNFKLYKAKKQWITACATFLLTFGATTVMNVSAHADVNSDSGNTTPQTAEVASATSSNSGDSSKGAANSAASSEQSESQMSNKSTSSVTKDTVNPNSVASSETSTIKSSEKNGNNQTTSQTLTVTGQTTKINSNALKESKAVAENIAPIGLTNEDNSLEVIPGTNLANDAKYFIKNYSELEKAGAKFSWVSYDDPNGETHEVTDNNFVVDSTATDYYSATIKVTYADGTSTDVDTVFRIANAVTLNPSKYYYVSKVGDAADLNTADVNGNSLSGTLLNYSQVKDPDAITVKVKPLDTSTIGIHWAEVKVTDNSVLASGEDGYSNGQPIRIIGGSYIVKVPYVVQGLNLLSNIPTDKNGDPVINAQLDHASAPIFDPTSAGNTAWGEYFYQDYALAYALGIKIKATDWTAPTADAKTNHFTLNLLGLPNAKKQNVVVNYVTPDGKFMYIFNTNNGSNTRGYASGYGKNNSTFRNNSDALR
ncbi:MAG TPA: KxYKxGKxW signal peptide domain-containing protein [Candidatus Limosilactobacillus excrementigallinarum]|nr:KxYKxGKxW signal peptide domain-containing protein [Candidatus Limosilactobacillus excrementigallinarum]